MKKDVHYYSSDTEEFILSAAWLLLHGITIHVLQNTWCCDGDKKKWVFLVCEERLDTEKCCCSFAAWFLVAPFSFLANYPRRRLVKAALFPSLSLTLARSLSVKSARRREWDVSSGPVARERIKRKCHLRERKERWRGSVASWPPPQPLHVPIYFIKRSQIEEMRRCLSRPYIIMPPLDAFRQLMTRRLIVFFLALQLSPKPQPDEMASTEDMYKNT